MSDHTIRPIDDYWRGDTRFLVFIVIDGDAAEENARKDLTGSEIDWWLTRHEGRELEIASDGVTLVVPDPSTGEFEIRISAETTDPLSATIYRERLRIVDANGRRVTWGSKFEVEAP